MIVPSLDVVPADADFEARVRRSFGEQAAMTLIGAELVEVVPGRIVMTLAHSERVTQQHGFIHAGLVATALDSACGYAASTLMPADAGVLDDRVQGQPAGTGPRTGAAHRGPRHQGRPHHQRRRRHRLEPHPSRPDQEQAVATITATLMCVTGRDDVRH